MFITSTRCKLEVLQKHYQLLSKMSVDSETGRRRLRIVYMVIAVCQRKLGMPFKIRK